MAPGCPGPPRCCGRRGAGSQGLACNGGRLRRQAAAPEPLQRSLVQWGPAQRAPRGAPLDRCPGMSCSPRVGAMPRVGAPLGSGPAWARTDDHVSADGAHVLGRAKLLPRQASASEALVLRPQGSMDLLPRWCTHNEFLLMDRGRQHQAQARAKRRRLRQSEQLSSQVRPSHVPWAARSIFEGMMPYHGSVCVLLCRLAIRGQRNVGNAIPGPLEPQLPMLPTSGPARPT